MYADFFRDFEYADCFRTKADFFRTKVSVSFVGKSMVFVGRVVCVGVGEWLG